MSHRRTLAVAIAGAVVLAVVVGGALGLELTGDPDARPTATSGSLKAGDTNAPAGSPSASPADRSGTSSGAAPSADPSAAPSGSSGSNGGVEVQPETPGETPSGLPGLQDPAASEKARPRWDVPAEAASARGRLVAGYPTALLPSAPRASVVTSSVAPSGERFQAALVARRAQRPDGVLRFYRTRLARAGFDEHPIAAVGGATATAFTRGESRVVVTVDPSPARTYSVYATLGDDKA